MPKVLSSKIYEKVVRWPAYKIPKLEACVIFLNANIKNKFQNKLKLKKKMPKVLSSKIYEKVVRWPAYKIPKLEACVIFLNANIKNKFQNKLKLKKKMPKLVCEVKYVGKL